MFCEDKVTAPEEWIGRKNELNLLVLLIVFHDHNPHVFEECDYDEKYDSISI